MISTQDVTHLPTEVPSKWTVHLRQLPWISLLLIVALILVALFAPVLTPYSPIEQALPKNSSHRSADRRLSLTIRSAPICSAAICSPACSMAPR
jgi:hypothetical protein